MVSLAVSLLGSVGLRRRALRAGLTNHGHDRDRPPPRSAVAPLNFKLDPVHCMALFRIHHVGAGQFWGMFDDVSGTVVYPEDGSTAPTFDVTVKVESVHTGTEKLNRTIAGPQFFDAKEFESIRFVSTGWNLDR